MAAYTWFTVRTTAWRYVFHMVVAEPEFLTICKDEIPPRGEPS